MVEASFCLAVDWKLLVGCWFCGAVTSSRRVRRRRRRLHEFVIQLQLEFLGSKYAEGDHFVGGEAPIKGLIFGGVPQQSSWKFQTNVLIPAPSKGWCLNPKGLLNGTLYHPFGTPWRVQVVFVTQLIRYPGVGLKHYGNYHSVKYRNISVGRILLKWVAFATYGVPRVAGFLFARWVKDFFFQNRFQHQTGINYLILSHPSRYDMIIPVCWEALGR